MKRFVISILIMCAFVSLVSASDDSVKLIYRKEPTPGKLSVMYKTTELNSASALVTDSDYDIETDEVTNFPFVVTWTGNMTTADAYTVTFSTDGWKHESSDETVIAVNLNVAAGDDQNPNLNGSQTYASVSAANPDALSVVVPALTNTDTRDALQLASFYPTWTRGENLTAGSYNCTINIDVTAGE